MHLIHSFNFVDSPFKNFKIKIKKENSFTIINKQKLYQYLMLARLYMQGGL